MKAGLTTALVGIAAFSLATFHQRHGVAEAAAAGRGPGPVRAERRQDRIPPVPSDREVAVELGKVSSSDWLDPENRALPLSMLLRWAARSPGDCLMWVSTRPEEIREVLLTEIAGSLTATRPDDALSFANELTPGPIADEMIRQIAMEYATRQPDESLVWARQQADPTTRDLLLSAVLVVQSTNAPQAAAEAALQIEDRALRDRSLVEISQRWAEKNPAEASAFVVTLDASLIVPAAVQLVSLWPPREGAACVKWIAALPTAEGRREVLTALLQQPGFQERTTLGQLMAGTTDPAMIEVIRLALTAR